MHEREAFTHLRAIHSRQDTGLGKLATSPNNNIKTLNHETECTIDRLCMRGKHVQSHQSESESIFSKLVVGLNFSFSFSLKSKIVNTIFFLRASDRELAPESPILL